ncbi:MAG: hypothetical protein ACM3NZ_01600 [Betaproteobacteria bacterium]|jgi:hypothetical protein
MHHYPVSSGARRGPFETRPLAEGKWQVFESRGLFFGPILVIGRFSLPGAGLSERIYKICTPLSTGFVENIRRRWRGMRWKPRRGAGFRGVLRFRWGGAGDALTAAG